MTCLYCMTRVGRLILVRAL